MKENGTILPIRTLGHKDFYDENAIRTLCHCATIVPNSNSIVPKVENAKQFLKTETKNMKKPKSYDSRDRDDWFNKRKELEPAARPYMPNYLHSVLHLDNLSKNFRCPFHEDKKPSPSMAYYADSQTVHCFAHCGTFDIFGLHAKLNGHYKPEKKDYDDIFEMYNLITPTGRKVSKPKIKPIESPPTAKKLIVDRSKDIAEYAANIEKTDYWSKRGLTLDTVKHFKLGFCERWRHPDSSTMPFSARLIIPTGDCIHSYAARRIDNIEDYKIIKVGTAELFHIDGFNGDYVIISEGEFDAMSIWQVGFQNSVGLGGVGNTDKFVEKIKSLETKPKFVIIALDNDKPGLDAAQWLNNELSNLNIYSLIVNDVFGEHKDANGLLQHDSELLKTSIQSSIDKANKEYENYTPPIATNTKSEITNIDDETFINLFKKKKYKEAETLAVNFLDEFIKFDDNFNIRNINQPSILYAAGLCRNSSDASYQASYDEFRIKCKDTKGIKVTGFNGLDEKADGFYSKLDSIRQAFIDDENEQRRQNTKEQLKKRIAAGEVLAPLPLNEIELPPELDFDVDNNRTISIDNEGNTFIKFNSINLITKRLNNVDTGEQKIEIGTIKSNSKNWSYIVAEREIIATNHKITTLATKGLDVISRTAPSMVDYLHEFENLNYELIPTIKTVSQTGWRGNDFVYPNTDGDYQLDDSIKPQLDKIFTVKGDKAIVIPLIKKIKEIDVANVNLGALLAAPLIHIFNCENIVVHTYGLAGSGKTTQNSFLFSLFGNPNAPEAIPTADATRVGLENYFAGRHDLPAIIEDINSISDKKSKALIQKLPLQFGNTKGRLRGKIKGGNQKLIDFRGSLLTNDEKPLTTDTSAGGSKRRVIELKTDNEMFNPELLSELNEVIEENYGLFGRDWIELIKAHKDDMKSMYNQIRKGTANVTGLKNEFSNKVPRHIHMIAAFVTAHIFFDVYILDMDFNDANKKELDCARRVLQILPDKAEIADFERAKPIIRDWFLQHRKKFVDDSAYGENTTQYNESKTFEEYGIIKKTFIAFNPKVFKDMLKDYEFSPEMIIKQLADDEFITRDGNNLEKKVRIKGLDKPTRMIVIEKIKLFNDDDFDE